MAALSNEIHDCPVPLSDLEVFLFKSHEFCASESASEQNGDHGYVTGATDALAICFLKQQASLVAIEPVADPTAKLFHAFNSPDSCRQFRLNSPESAAS
jgi:hypothetical protein